MASGFADQGPLRLEPSELGDLDALAEGLLNAPEQELQTWADQQMLQELRVLPNRLEAAMEEHDRRRERLVAIRGRLQDVMSAATRGHTWLEEPQAAAAEAPMVRAKGY